MGKKSQVFITVRAALRVSTVGLKLHYLNTFLLRHYVTGLLGDFSFYFSSFLVEEKGDVVFQRCVNVYKEQLSSYCH